MSARRHRIVAAVVAVGCAGAAMAVAVTRGADPPTAGAAGQPWTASPVAATATAPTSRDPARPLFNLRMVPPHTAQPTPASPAARACGGLPAFSAATAGQIMAGQLSIAPFPVATVDPQRDGDIDWGQNPFDDPTWTQDFRSGDWIEQLVAGYLAAGPDAAAYLARAAELTRSWLAAVPVSARDPNTLVCISQAFPGQAWIQDQIPPTVDWYAANWMGAWNHGLMQDIMLLRIGCGYPATAFGGDALKWRQTAVSQMISAFGPNPLGPAVDAQGAVNEQATLYEDFVYNLWRVALPMLSACGYTLPSWITARIAELPTFLAYATQPDGNLVQIGDTYVERPAVHRKVPNLVAVYDAGYIFGRSGWTPAASFYSLRFGPGREIHGHADHMGLTYYARGRDLIVEAGHYGYQDTPYRQWLEKSPTAASTLVMPGVPFSTAASTSLIADQIGRYGQFYEFYDTAFDGDPRYRSVYVDQRPDIVVVFDRASGAPSYQQLWHLDPALTVTHVGSSSAIASAPGTELALLRVALPGQVIPSGSVTVVRGQTDPYQGWVSHQMLQQIPADVVEMNQQGPTAAILTVIVPTAPGTSVTATASGPPGGPYLLQVRIGHAVSTFTVTADGTIS
jgi:Heparinase II/III-like protein